jgi:hypothetical protein
MLVYNVVWFGADWYQKREYVPSRYQIVRVQLYGRPTTKEIIERFKFANKPITCPPTPASY